MHDELYHFGVKGMKWGVRKTPEYKTYIKRRRGLTRQAELDGRWERAYNRTVKRNEKHLSKKVEKDIKKSGQVSDKTKKLLNAHQQLKRDASYARINKKTSFDNLQKFVDKSVKTLGKENVKDIKTFTYKGEKYVRKILSSDSASYSVQRRKKYDENGDSYLVWTPVRTTYQTY